MNKYIRTATSWIWEAVVLTVFFLLGAATVITWLIVIARFSW